MSKVPEILQPVVPENALREVDGLTWGTDEFGDPYIVLTKEVRKPLPFDPVRPGEGVMIHMMNKHDAYRGPLEKVTGLIKKQGFFSPVMTARSQKR